MIRSLRRLFLRWEIKSLELRIYEDQRAVDLWPTDTKPAFLRELARLKQSLDRLNGRHRDVVSYLFTGGKK